MKKENKTSGGKAFLNWDILLLMLLALLSIAISFISVFKIYLPGALYYSLALFVVLMFVSVKYFLVVKQKKNIAPAKTYYQTLFQSYPDACIVYDKESLEVIDHNIKLLQLFELTDEASIKGIYLVQFMMRHLADDSENMDLMMNKIPDEWKGEAGFITKNKNKFIGNVNNIVVKENDHEYHVLTICDTSKAKAAERELINSKLTVEKASRAKARFLSSMSHELRTPLNGIIGISNIILSEPGLTESLKKNMNTLRYSSEHMLGIVNDILDFSKIDAGKLELKQHPFNLKDCIHNITSSFASQFTAKGIHLVTNIDSKLFGLSIISDEIKLSQVISNLLSNALKFTATGSVTLTINLQNSIDEKATIYFEVKDTGIGIAKEKQSEIFQGFAQVHVDEIGRKYGGTGLGLTISEKLVAKFGGNLQVESELIKGSRFYFTITFSEATATPNLHIKNIDPIATKDIRGVKILVVEDNEINEQILKNFLRKWQVQIKSAGNGVHALELMKYHKFDIVLMDLEMPEMDGYAAIKKIRETNKEVVVIAFTATLLENMDNLITTAGFNDYVLKPFRPAELKKKIQFYAERKVDYA